MSFQPVDFCLLLSQSVIELRNCLLGFTSIRLDNLVESGFVERVSFLRDSNYFAFMEFLVVVSTDAVVDDAAGVVSLMSEGRGRVEESKVEGFGDGLVVGGEERGLDGVEKVFLEGLKVLDGVVGLEGGPVQLFFEFLNFLVEHDFFVNSGLNVLFESQQFILHGGFFLDNNGFDFLSFGEIGFESFVVVVELFELLLGGEEREFEFGVVFVELFDGEFEFVILFELSFEFFFADLELF